MADKEASSWSNNRRESTPEKLEGIERVDPVSGDDIVGGVVLSNPIVFGVPDRSEIFRLALLADRPIDMHTDPFLGAGKWLRVFNRQQLQLPEFVVTACPEQEPGDVVETAVDVLMQAISCDIALHGIRVLECRVTDEGREVVFIGTEAANPMPYRTIRVLRVTVHANGLAAHEVISGTSYPG